MIREHGDMFKLLDDPSYSGIFFVTTNNRIKSGYELVMGAGCAKTLRDRFLGIATEFAKLRDKFGHEYGCFYTHYAGYTLGALQTKYDWKDPSPIELIAFSLAKLGILAAASERRIDIPFPGVNHGGLRREQVQPLLEVLPNNVFVWTFD